MRAAIREEFAKEGLVKVEPVAEKTKEPTKFETYYNYEEKAGTIPSHRYLAIRRGEAEGVLRAEVAVDKIHAAQGVERLLKVNPKSPFASELRTAAMEATTRLLLPSLESDVRAREDASLLPISETTLAYIVVSSGSRATRETRSACPTRAPNSSCSFGAA